MGASTSRVPRYEVIDPQASSSESPRPLAGSFSPPTQGLVQPQNSQWAPVQQAPAPPLPVGWDFAIDPASGYPYFFHTQSQISQWDDPRGPGFGLPERDATSTDSAHPQRVIPPWEGGPANGVDPLTWPLPPGWQEQLDLATNQRYFVNYDARIMSYNDPRLEIAKAYTQGPVAEGIPVYYPPPAYGRVTDTSSQQQFRPPAGFGTQGASSPGHQYIQQSYPPPPPPAKKKHASMWSRLGYRHGSGRVKNNRPLQMGLLAGYGPYGYGGAPPSSSSSSSSSTSSDDSDDDRDSGVGDAFGGVGGRLLFAQTFGDDGDDGSSAGLPDHGDAGTSGGDMGAIDEYGLLTEEGGGGGGGAAIEASSGGSGGVSASGDFNPEQSFRGWQSEAKFSFLKLWSTASQSHPSSQGGRLWMFDGYSRLVIVLTLLVGVYFGAFEGLLSLVFAFAGKLILSLRKSTQLIKARRKTARNLRNVARWAFRKASTLIRVRSSLSTTLAEMQAWFYEHVYDHPLVKLRMLTAKDEAGPLHSRLPLRPREITIVTQASADRLPAIEAMATSWGGAMCVAIHIRSISELKQLYPKLRDLHARIEAQDHCRLDVCVATEDGLSTDTPSPAALYPINAMRNLALSMAATELVFILDADFVPSKGMHDVLTGDEKLYSGLLRMAVEERQMLVIPAFESTSGKFEVLERTKAIYPTTYQDLCVKWMEGAATAFHCSHFARGHKPTNYERFLNPSTSGPYKVQYREFYEPYVVCARELIPPFDARFRGYGMNKISHAYHCAAKGMGFAVLPQVFVWSLPHLKSQAWTYTFGARKDPAQKLRILGLYRKFKSEVQRERRFNRNAGDDLRLELLEVRVEQPPQECRHASSMQQE
ncbi:hypothetical protein Mapa_006343 [Marchantia paleacea]|nr:hypothetical protein Mapa_006343 [Marchantia paleacea]